MTQDPLAILPTWRQHLHRHPELSNEERETAAFVCARLAELGIPFTPGVGGNGVVATLDRGGNRSVGLRADMDALPIQEATGLPYASAHPGVMHACGHDGHTTSLLGAAMLLRDDPSWSGTVRFVFQPAEEGAGKGKQAGALSMLADGLLQRFPMERIFAYHNWPGLAAGTVAVHAGPVMAQGGRVNITIDGHAGHAAMPHLTRDAVLAAGHVLVALQSVVARNVDPLEAAVVSIGVVEAGQAANQIPARVTLRGTLRALRPEVFEAAAARIVAVVQHTGAALDVRATADVARSVAATVNHAAEAELAATAAAQAGLPVRRDLAPSMAGEDFGWLLRELPGAYVWIGNGPAHDGAFLHNQGYDFNDAILPTAATCLAAIARRALAEA
jgi:amidohydrolase